MRIEKVQFDIEKVKALKESISNEELKSLLNNYHTSLDQIITTLAIPYMFMTVGYQQGMLKLMPYSTGMRDIEKLGGFKEKNPKKTAKALVKHFEDKIKESNTQSFELAEEEINKLLENAPPLTDAYVTLGHNSLVNSWTLFEALTKDLWRYVLNSKPHIFIHQLLKSRNNSLNDVEGINGKQISMNLLSKYDFNISEHLGDILSPKYDFTSVKGIKIAFKELLKLAPEDLAFLDKKELNQLEISRHLIVHNAGIIDEDYLKRSSLENENLNEKIEISHEYAGKMINSSIESVAKITTIIDERIKL